MAIRTEFEKRILEINSFYEILELVEMENPRLLGYDISESKEKIVQINSTKIDTLRSTSYLLLYNLIESTVYNAVTTVFDEIKDNNLKYFEIIEDVRKYWLNNIYKHDDKKQKETIIETIMKIADQILSDTIELSSNEINYGGSLDARNIFATARSMKIGIGNIQQIYDENIHGQIMVDVKKKRNWLAHGEKSFIEVGSSSTYTELSDAKKYICDFLDEFINSVDNYIINKHYKITA